MTGAIGHIYGSGISAAMMRLGLRGLADRGIADAVEQLNRLVYEMSSDNSYATLFLARICAEAHRLEYVNAGHEPALLVRKTSNRTLRLERTGTVLGLKDCSRYARRSVAVESGDVLAAFTEGISLGEREIVEMVRHYPDARACDLVRAILILDGEAASAADRTAIAWRVMSVAEKPFDLLQYAEQELAAA